MHPLVQRSLYEGYMLNRSLLVFLGLVLSMSVLASEELIKKSLLQFVADPQHAVIKASPVPGLYQVAVDGQIIYMSADGRYLFSGDLIDLETRSNLTNKAKAGLVKLELDKLDTSSMIIYPAIGETKHVITVFTDIDCQFCTKLHVEIPKFNEQGVEVRYLAYPRTGVGSPSYHKAVSVWCADNQNKMMDKAMLGQTVATKTCNNPVKSHLALVGVFNVRGTPNIVLEDGRVMPGYVSAEKLINILNKN